MNDSKRIAERAAREINRINRARGHVLTDISGQTADVMPTEEMAEIVERAIAESQAPQPEPAEWCCDGKQASGEDQHNPDCRYHHSNWKPPNPPPTPLISSQIAIESQIQRDVELGDGEPSQAPQEWAENWARDFHDTYERTAPKFGYQTREESAVPWAEVPENNRKLMIAVCAEVLCRFEKWRSGAAQEVSPPSPDKFKDALELIENYDSSCECDDHTQPECCANVSVSDCFCAHCIAGKALL